MGYFSNGTEGEAYEARYCARCVHRDGPDGKSACAVMLAHMLRNYDDCNDDTSILHLLIPRSKDGLGNEQCRMFHKGKPVEESDGLTDADMKYLKWRQENVVDGNAP